MSWTVDTFLYTHTQITHMKKGIKSAVDYVAVKMAIITTLITVVVTLMFFPEVILILLGLAVIGFLIAYSISYDWSQTIEETEDEVKFKI